MKKYFRTTEDFKTVSGIFVHNEKGLYLGDCRKYCIYPDGSVYCEINNTGEIKRTTLKNLTNMRALKKYDNEIFGDVFQ